MISRVYCPHCNKLEFQLKYKSKDSWYGNCEYCGRYIEGVKEIKITNFQVDYNMIYEMEKDEI